MKRLFYFVMLPIAVLFFTVSCNSDDPDYHALGVSAMSATTYPVTYYADQTKDTVIIVSTDSWSSNTECDWIKYARTGNRTVSKSATYNYGNKYQFKECIIINPNTTNKVRDISIHFDANGKTVGLAVSQKNWMNVTNPAKAATGLVTDDGYDFVKTVKASDDTTSVKFTIYNPATLATSADWITVPAETFEAGACTAIVTLQHNTTGAKRDGKITLKSSVGVSTDIIIRQEAK